MENLSVYSASAGSGKTFTIAYEYISMMLKAASGTADSYRNILAVTFTNKACDEMKSRIVLNLFLISNFYKVSGSLKSRINDIIAKIQGKTGLPENEIVTKSKIFFTQIIHDYSFFSVFTIDSFFQKIVRNLAYELGLQQNYELELNTDLIISQLVDDIMLRAETDKDLNANIVALIDDNIELGNKWSPKVSIKNFITVAVASDFSGLDCDIDEYESRIDAIVKEFCEKFKQIIDRIGVLIQQNGLKEDDFYKRANYNRRFDAFYEYDLKPYDVAAGIIILQEAGGNVCDFSCGSNYLFGGEMVATNSLIFDEFSAIVKKFMNE